MRDTQEGGHLGFKTADLFAVDELRALQQPVPLLYDFSANMSQLASQI
jgi:hypothetical protein